MFFQHVYDKSLAQGSYVIGCQKTGEALVIDPKRDIDTYLDIARSNKLNITHITETHIHADFLCGSRELAAVTGAELFLSDEGGPEWQYEFPHTGLRDGDVLHVGNLSLRVMHTPGHTPESLSFVLTDHPASEDPVMVFTGDFVFVGDIGRPDLLEKAAGQTGTKEGSARQMFKSLEKFKELPSYLQLWSGHGAGSACGKALGSVPSSTVGYELRRNWALQFDNDEDAFVENLLAGQPEPPRYFAQMKLLNKTDRPLLTEIPRLEQLSAAEFLNAFKKGVTVIDTRPKQEFADGFLPGTIHIQANNAFATWMGWLVSYDEPFILITSAEKVEDLTRRLMRIGMDQCIGYVTDLGSMGLALEKVDQVDFSSFQEMAGDQNVQVIDVRNQGEFDTNHIEGATHLFLGNLPSLLGKIDTKKKVVVHCQAGDRSSTAYSIMIKHGLKNVLNYGGGMQEWSKNHAAAKH